MQTVTADLDEPSEDAGGRENDRAERRCLGERSGAPRAAVSGVNDGLVSNAALVTGSARSGSSGTAVVFPGIAGLPAGVGSSRPQRRTPVAGRRWWLTGRDWSGVPGRCCRAGVRTGWGPRVDSFPRTVRCVTAEPAVGWTQVAVGDAGAGLPAPGRSPYRLMTRVSGTDRPASPLPVRRPVTSPPSAPSATRPIAPAVAMPFAPSTTK